MNCHTSERFNINKCYQREAKARVELIRKHIHPLYDPEDATFQEFTDYLLITIKQFELLHNFTKAHFERDRFHLLQDNDDCMKQHSSVALYWTAHEWLNSQSERLQVQYNLEDRQWGGINLNYHQEHDVNF